VNDAQSNCVPVDHLALVRKTIARRIAALTSAAHRVRAADDNDATHDLRVCARSLDAMLQTWDCLFPARARKDALRALRQVRRRLGQARELQMHVSLLEPRAWQQGEPFARLLLQLRERLLRRAHRAARLLRPKRFERLLGRIEAATREFEAGPATDSHLLDRARTRALQTGAVARVALELACARDDEWMLHQARIAAKKWRYAVESVAEVAPISESQLLDRVRDIQKALGTFQDRATLMDAILRTCRSEERAGLQSVLDELEREKQAAIREFKTLVPRLGVRTPTRPPARQVANRPARAVARIPLTNGHGGADVPANGGQIAASERWEKMAQWLVATSAQK